MSMEVIGAIIIAVMLICAAFLLFIHYGSDIQ
jgi:hypothetical protein